MLQFKVFFNGFVLLKFKIKMSMGKSKKDNGKF